ncbi:uncharacterized protein LOC132143261 [Carassius carassius]|uniref:uncharacterized protein LOC132143261 n=1 Tax=Carassius carassius TaxID=217509 RepID=UPI0028692D0E|nr:uncharacterized protein LOC132143261 [Carassius carassius]
MHILGTTLFFIIALKVCLGFYLQTSEIQSYVGESVILSCNGSGFSEQELDVHWEAMGKDVISLRGDVVTVGRGFEDRVNFLSDPAESEDFSLILSDLMLNDGDVYECLWKETKPICSVLLQVLPPVVFTNHVEVFEGVDITLECFGNIPKNKPWEDIYIQWLKDDREVLRLSSGEMDISIDYRILRLPAKHDISRGIFSLSIPSVNVFDQGVYQCRYKSTDYEAPRSGFPETHTLTVSVMNTPVTDTDSGSAVSSEVWSSTASLSQTQAVWAQAESSSPVPTLTYTERDGALFLAMTDPTVTETVTHSVTTDISVPQTGIDSTYLTTDVAIPDTDIGSGQIPWIRIGLISTVLLVTAVVLALLLVSGRIVERKPLKGFNSQTFPADGGVSCADGGTSCADGGTSCADGGVSCADGGVSCADGGVSCADGGVSCADGGASCADGGESCADGGASCADGGASYGGASCADGGASCADGARRVLMGARRVLMGACRVLMGARRVLMGARRVLMGARRVLMGRVVC